MQYYHLLYLLILYLLPQSRSLISDTPNRFIFASACTQDTRIQLPYHRAQFGRLVMLVVTISMVVMPRHVVVQR